MNHSFSSSYVRPAMQPLRSLLEGLPAAAVTVPDTSIVDLTLDSRAVTPGALFVALAGSRDHGLRHAHDAIARGAVAVVYEPTADVSPRDIEGVPAIAVPQLREALGVIADRFFDMPSAHMDVVAVTGTNGKTTTAWLIAAALDRLGQRAAYAGTLGFGVVGNVQPRPHTTPDCITVHRELASMRAQQTGTVAMEVTSHAMDQLRVAGVRFQGAVFTNLTHDHLDYHGTLEAYAEAKAKLFAWPGLRYAVINADDAFGRILIERCAARLPTIACSQKALEAGAARPLFAADVQMAARGLEIRVDGDFGAGWIHSRLVGAFNVDNLLATLGVLLSRGLPLSDAVRVLSEVTPPPGRMQTFSKVGSPLVLVDYAHTPDALAKALTAARAHTQGRLICVFGCGGERDVSKRPAMGRLASELADVVVVTDDNPRGEDGEAIVDAIVAGAVGGAEMHVQRDRRRAIELGVAAAREGDVVLVAGKGHEDYQIVGGERRYFSDAEVVLESLEARS